MISLYMFVTPPGACSYLPGQQSRMKYNVVSELTADEYQTLLDYGWRRFGHSLFRPDCTHCQACQSLRVDVPGFRPNQSQRRAMKANADTRRIIGPPDVSHEKLELYDKFHAHQAATVGWRDRGPEDAVAYVESFVTNPFATEEWCYYVGDSLVGVGYVDRLPRGLSLIYFYHDPDHRDRSLGTFNVLSALADARGAGLPYVYLGFHVAECRSLAYKANFRPHQRRDNTLGDWVGFE
jgi:leucyl-tRNA---protein transferase